MTVITKITVGVKRRIAFAKAEYVEYSCHATADVLDSEAPIQVYEDTLAFCQDKILQELERLEQGRSPKQSMNVHNEDYLPNFQTQTKVTKCTHLKN